MNLAPEIFGHKSVAIFDIWSFPHFLSGCAIFFSMNIFEQLTRRNVSQPILLVLVISLTWEIIGMHLEVGFLIGERVVVWFDGVEHWSNRLIGDPLMSVLGFLLASRFPQIALPAKFIALIWLAVHVFAFPNSMYLYENRNGS